MIEIQLSNSELTAWIDDDPEVYSEISRYKWRVNHNGYAEVDRKTSLYRTYKTRKMHRIIYMILNSRPINFDLVIVDHKDGDTLNNQMKNLRLATPEENSRNRKTINKAGYKGISWCIRSKKWIATIHYNKKKVYLGRFDCPKLGAIAYNDAATKYFGEFAKLNVIE